MSYFLMLLLIRVFKWAYILSLLYVASICYRNDVDWWPYSLFGVLMAYDFYKDYDKK